MDLQDLFKNIQLKILHLEANRYSSQAIKKISSLGRLTIAESQLDQEGLKTLLSNEDFDIIFTKLGLYLGVEELQVQPKLRCVATPTTGLNHIDIEAAKGQGIEIISLKGESDFLASIQSTAEHTWSLLLSGARNLVPASQSTLEGQWDRECFLADELNTKTLGIIGFGRLGKILFRYAKAFQMKILLNDINPEVFDESSSPYSVELTELLQNSDYIVLLVDYRVENTGMINKSCFDLMKRSAYFINTSRGELVDEEALLNALQKNELKGAALDVIAGDSTWNMLPNNHPLIVYANQNNNLLVTPHMGGYGKVSITKTRDFIVDKLLDKCVRDI